MAVYATAVIAFVVAAFAANALLGLILVESRFSFRALDLASVDVIITLSLVAMLCSLLAYETLSHLIRWRD